MLRRDCVAGLVALILPFRTAAGWAQSADAILGSVPPLPAGLEGHSGEPPAPFVEMGVVGTAEPSTTEKDMAYDIMLGSPWGCSPIEVAEYFLAVGAGAFGNEWQPFAREWPVRANPVVFHLFSSTQTRPEGDTTAWCAAFANWCILRAKATARDEIGASPGRFSRSGKPFPTDNMVRFSTNSASSGSFRCWQQTINPKRGDIVVFKDAGTEALTPSCRGSGHVAFYLGEFKPGFVRVVGGNQTLSGSGGAVTVSDMSMKEGSRFMKVVSLK